MKEFESRYPVGSNEWYYEQIVNDSKENPNNRTFTIAHVPKDQKAAVSRLLREGFGGNESDKRFAGAAQTVATMAPLAGLSAMPAVSTVMGSVMSHPVTQAIGTALGLYNLVTDNGVRKTVDKWNEGDTKGFVQSLAGDALDASPLIGGIKFANTARKLYNLGTSVKDAANIAKWELPILSLFQSKGYRLGKELLNNPLNRSNPNYYEAIRPVIQIYNTSSREPQLVRIPGAGGIKREVVPFSRPITEAERFGMPKKVRNQPEKIQSYGDIQSANVADALRVKRYKSNELPLTKEQILSETNPEYRANMEWNTEKIKRNINDRYKNFLDDQAEIAKFNERLSKYISSLEDVDIHPAFKSTIVDGESYQSPVVKSYRRYLQHQGVDARNISDEDLAKFLTHQYNNLANQQIGKAKGTLLFHGSDTYFDKFDLDKIGSYTGNSGAVGPGIYFSNYGARYDHRRDPFSNGTIEGNFQPYLINGIKSTPDGRMMQEKGILDDYSSYVSDVHIKNAKEKIFKNMLFGDLHEFNVGAYDINKDRAAYMYRGDNIKSVFPHPSLLQEATDGTVYMLPRTFDRGRLNYKSGGKIQKHQEGNTVESPFKEPKRFKNSFISDYTGTNEQEQSIPYFTPILEKIGNKEYDITNLSDIQVDLLKWYAERDAKKVNSDENISLLQGSRDREAWREGIDNAIRSGNSIEDFSAQWKKQEILDGMYKRLLKIKEHYNRNDLGENVEGRTIKTDLYYKGIPKREVVIHETDHGSRFTWCAAPNVVELCKKLYKNYSERTWDDREWKNYLSHPEEVHARIMEFRLMNNLNPNYTVTKEDIEKWKSEWKSGNSKLYIPKHLFKDTDSQALADLFNLMAHSNSKRSVSSPISIAESGTKLSPEKLISKVKNSPAEFVKRLTQFAGSVPDWEKQGAYSTHKLAYVTNDDGTATVYPEVQMVDGKLVDFTRPPYHSRAGLDSALEHKDTVNLPNANAAEWFTTNYKKYFKGWEMK